MAELLRTNDPVLMSFAEALLIDGGIAHHVADRHQSIMEGSIGALQMRILVADDDIADARQALIDGGLEQHVIP